MLSSQHTVFWQQPSDILNLTSVIGKGGIHDLNNIMPPTKKNICYFVWKFALCPNSILLLFPRNEWGQFHAFTNVLWIHYLADKLIHGKTYTQTSNTTHLTPRHIRSFLREALDYNSAVHLFHSCAFFDGDS